MPVITAPAQPTHQLGSTRFTSLATPSRGSAETAIWQVEIAPASPATPHSLTREEIFVVLDGTATVFLDGVESTAGVGDAIVLPAGVQIELRNGGDGDLRMLCLLPVGGEATLPDGSSFAPPWSQ
jgi:quercetin dioxygenase-like cupin family protein